MSFLFTQLSPFERNSTQLVRNLPSCLPTRIRVDFVQASPPPMGVKEGTP